MILFAETVLKTEVCGPVTRALAEKRSPEGCTTRVGRDFSGRDPALCAVGAAHLWAPVSSTHLAAHAWQRMGGGLNPRLPVSFSCQLYSLRV